MAKVVKKKPGEKKTAKLRVAKKKPSRRTPEPVAIAERDPPTARRALTLEIDQRGLEESLEELREEVVYWARRGVESKVRFRFRGKAVLPDIPFAAFLAAEAATFWWAGLLRALVVNVGGRALIDVEVISNAEPHLARGKEHLLAGDIDEALDSFKSAVAADRNLAGAHHDLGICYKVKGDRKRALTAFRKARALDPDGEVGRNAGQQIDKLSV